MDSLFHYLFTDGWLSLREVFRLLLLSGLFTVVCLRVFPQNAPSRRLFLLIVVSTLCVLPWVLASIDAVWPLPLQHPPHFSLSEKTPNLVVLIWLVVAAVMIARHLWSTQKEIRALQNLPLADDCKLAVFVDEVAEHVGIEVPVVQIGKSAFSTSLGMSRIVLPVHWPTWRDDTLRSVLLHEAIHISRRDDRWLLLTRLLVLCYWWMPWLIIVYQHYVQAMEESCDDLASELLGHEHTYVDALAYAAGVPRDDDSHRRVNVASMHEHHIVGRIGRFASTRVVEIDTPAIYWWLIGILALVGTMTSFEPVQFVPATAPYRYVSASAPVMANADRQGAALIPEIHEIVSIDQTISSAQRGRLYEPAYSPPVVYPGEALRSGWEGDAIVEFIVNRDGSVSAAHVVASERTVFAQSALRATLNTRYQPSYVAKNLHGQNSLTRKATNAFAEHQTPLRTAQSDAHIEPIKIRRTFQFRLSYR